MAYGFNGTNQRLTVASAPATTTPLTVACWFRTTNLTASQSLITLRDNTPSASANYYLLSFGGSNLSITVGPPNNTTGVSPGFLTNTWYHACGVFTSSTSRTVYANGVNSSSGTANYTLTGINTLDIGSFSTFVPLQGQMAEVGIWNAALTQDEIISLAKCMTCDKVRPQNLVFYAPLVRNLQDVKGGLSITNNNGATVTDHSRIYS